MKKTPMGGGGGGGGGGGLGAEIFSKYVCQLGQLAKKIKVSKIEII